MLDKLRKNRDSYAAKILLYALAGSFVIGFGVLPSLNDDSSSGTVVARVNDHTIYRRELDEAVLNMTRRYQEELGAAFDEKMIAQLQLERGALESLVNRQVLLQHAEDAGLIVTDEEVRDRILAYDAFKDASGRFDERLYERALRGAGTGLTPARFENDIREMVVIERVRGMVNGSVLVTDDQLREIFVADREKANVAYVALGAEDVASDVKVSKADLDEYYEANREDYALPERRRFAYVELSPAALTPMFTASQEELLAAYEKHKDDFRVEEEVRASHVLFKVDADADEAAWEAAREKAADVAARARKGEDFAKLAKVHSEDTSAADGGDLGAFGRGRMVKPFEDAAFTLNAGEVSDPVRTLYGYHVIKVAEKREAGAKPFEDVQAELTTLVKREKADAKLPQIEADVAKQLESGAALADVAAQHGLFVQKTPYLTAGDGIPGLLGSQLAVAEGFKVERGAATKLVEFAGSKVALSAEEIEPARQPEFAEVRGKVEQALRLERAAGLAATRAAELLDQAKKSGSLEKAARRYRYPVEETGEFTQRQGEVPGLQSPDVYRAVFTLRDPNKFPDRTFHVNGKYYVIEVRDRQHADLAQFAEAKEEIAEQLREQKGEQLFSDWLLAARARANVKIEMQFEPAAGMPGVPANMPMQRGG